MLLRKLVATGIASALLLLISTELTLTAQEIKSQEQTTNPQPDQKPFAIVEVNDQNNVLQVALVDGTREPMNGEWVNVTIKDKQGAHTTKVRLQATAGYLTFTLPVAEADHTFELVISRKGYKSASFKASPDNKCIHKAMLIPKKTSFVFDPSLQQLRQVNPAVYELYSAGRDETTTQLAYDALRANEPAKLAGFMNIAVALQSLKPEPLLPFYKSIVAIQQDRFFAFADEKIVAELERGVEEGTLKQQNRLDLLLHRGSTSSYKEVDLPEANVQITLHKKVTTTIDGIRCILVETDIDYFKSLWKHAFLEVVPNLTLHRKTNPKAVYRFRWRNDDFKPPYVLASLKN